MMQVSIIIPNFNGKDLLSKNLQFVIQAKQNKKNNIKEIIIVDDGSSDDSVEFLRKNFKDEVKLIVHKKNRGFATSINTGVRMAKSELVCLLNSDVIPASDFLAKIEEDFEDPKVFAVSLHEKGYGYAKGKFAGGFIVHQGMVETHRVEETFWASGGSSVINRDIFMNLKGMDDVLLSPFYWEDLDLSYRAQKRGYKILWDPRANVIHEHESTVKKLNQKMVSDIRERNQLLFIWKNLTSQNLMKKHRVELIRRIRKHPGYLRIVFMALQRFNQMKKLRAIEIKETNCSDEAIFGKFN
jgi:GT2 family glycosyltransferase